MTYSKEPEDTPDLDPTLTVYYDDLSPEEQQELLEDLEDNDSDSPTTPEP